MILHEEFSPSSELFQSLGMRVFATERRNKDIFQQIDWILKCIRSISPDVFLSMSSVAGGYAGHWIKRAGIPTAAVHVSDDDFNWGLAQLFGCNSEWSVSGLSCISKQLTERTRVLSPIAKIATIPHGTSLPKHAVNQRTEKIKLVFSGRLEERQKQISKVYRAVARAVKTYPQINAKFIGSGSQLASLKNQTIADGLQHRIDWVGYVDQEQVMEQLQQGHVLVLLSDYEGLPGAVIDAMACGLVPVCLRCPGGLDELVINNQTGIWVDDRESSFLKAMEELVNVPEKRATMGAAAQEHIRQNFTTEIAATLWETFLGKLIDVNPFKKSKLILPSKIDLPPVLPELAAEDIRQLPILSRAKNFLRDLLPKGSSAKGTGP